MKDFNWPVITDEWSPNKDDVRQDGTKKGQGFLGVLKRSDKSGGDISSELTIDIDTDQGKKSIPLMVPTLTDEEVNHLLSGKPHTKQILDKAVEHAKYRRSVGKDVYADVTESPQKQYSQDDFRNRIANAFSGAVE